MIDYKKKYEKLKEERDNFNAYMKRTDEALYKLYSENKKYKRYNEILRRENAVKKHKEFKVLLKAIQHLNKIIKSKNNQTIFLNDLLDEKIIVFLKEQEKKA